LHAEARQILEARQLLTQIEEFMDICDDPDEGPIIKLTPQDKDVFARMKAALVQRTRPDAR
jgi:hypothetical protein